MSDLTESLERLRQRFSAQTEGAIDERELDGLRVRYLGRQGEVTQLRRGIGTLPPDERKGAGKAINDVVAEMERRLDEALGALQARGFETELASSIDVTFPARKARLGSVHPVRRIIERTCDYFMQHGFAVVLGPEAEPEYYNFDALNIPADHPARESFDSFWLGDGVLLRPHTSPIQVRTMQRYPPPVAIVAPGKCYRRDATDARHLFQFHQVEGLLVAEGIHFGHLKGMLEQLCRELFGPRQKVRFRPSYFPFTEPSAEVDTTCPKCSGTGALQGARCGMCGGAGWIELGGAGMVHPNVLREVRYDPEKYSGWAFGFGAERLGLALYDVDDIRRFVTSEPDFLVALS